VLYVAWLVLPDACRLASQTIRLLGLVCLCVEQTPVALVTTVLKDSYIFWTTAARLAANVLVAVFLRFPLCLWCTWCSPPRRLQGRPTANHRAYIKRQRRPKRRRIQLLRVLLHSSLIAGAFASAPETAKIATALSGCNIAGAHLPRCPRCSQWRCTHLQSELPAAVPRRPPHRPTLLSLSGAQRMVCFWTPAQATT
jgi:hypothetical protein